MSNLIPNYSPLNISFTSGNGCWLKDTKGNKYLDCLSGISVVNLGHSHPQISSVIAKQAKTLIHTSNWYKIENQEILAKKICKLTNMDKVFFANSGSEANEAAIKITKLYSNNKGIKHPIILTAKKSFHGRTIGALSATGSQKAQKGFLPLLDGFKNIEFNNIDEIKKYENNKNVVAIMLEPILGEAGVIIPNKNYLNNIKSICDKNNWLLILDEIQTGMGRTGKLFAHQYNNITPDIMTLAKALGNGIPIGACLTKGAIKDILTTGTHGSTFGGNPLATKVATEVLDIFENENILANVEKQSKYISSQLEKKLKNNNAVKEIRIKGLMIGVELNIDCSNLLENALKDNFLINITGKTIRLLPPLIINQTEVDIMIEKLISLINSQ